jgi:hypothetical protein
MSQVQEQEFEHRIRRLMRKHDRLSRGVVHRVGPDGLITAHPRRRVSLLPPLRAIVLVLAVGFLFKAYLLYALGGATYQARVDTLAEGSVFEQAGAMMMRPDPASTWLAEEMTRLLP